MHDDWHQKVSAKPMRGDQPDDHWMSRSEALANIIQKRLVAEIETSEVKIQVC